MSNPEWYYNQPRYNNTLPSVPPEQNGFTPVLPIAEPSAQWTWTQGNAPNPYYQSSYPCAPPNVADTQYM